MDVADELQRLADLHAAGDLDDQQYERAKALALSGGGATAAIRTSRPAVTPAVKKLKITPVNVLIGVVFAAFMIAAVGPSISRDMEKLAAPIACRAPYDDHTRISTFRYQSGSNDDYLICVSASGTTKEPGVFEVRAILFGAALIVLGILAPILLVPYFRRRPTKETA